MNQKKPHVWSALLLTITGNMLNISKTTGFNNYHLYYYFLRVSRIKLRYFTHTTHGHNSDPHVAANQAVGGPWMSLPLADDY